MEQKDIKPGTGNNCFTVIFNEPWYRVVIEPIKIKSIFYSLRLLGIYEVLLVETIGDPINKEDGFQYNVKVVQIEKYFLWIKYRTINYGKR